MLSSFSSNKSDSHICASQHESRSVRTRSVGKVMALFKKLNIDVLTRWRDAHAMLVNSDDWAVDEDLQNLPSLDILLAFEDYSRVKEREYEDQTRKDRVEKRRKERKAREGFKVNNISCALFD